ncbi:MAG: V-type ATP synthase subunit E [Candidatus Altiarchaeota archaeon]
MGYEELSESIRRQGEREAADIREKARLEAAGILRNWEEAADATYDRILEKAGQESDIILKQTVSKAKVDAKGVEANRKAEIMESVFEEAGKRILASDRQTQSKVLNRLAEGGRKVGDDVTVYVDKKYSKLIDRKKLEAWFKNAKIVERQIGFGVIVENSDKTVRVDNTLEPVFESLKKDLRPQVNKILFDKVM